MVSEKLTKELTKLNKNMSKEQIYRKELESLLEWLQSMKSEMSGEQRTNTLFTIEHLQKVLSN